MLHSTKWRYQWNDISLLLVCQVRSLQRHLTLIQLERHVGLHDGLPCDAKVALVIDSVARYRDGLKFGKFVVLTFYTL